MLCRLGEVIVVVDVHTKHVKRPWLLLETAFCRRLTARGLWVYNSAVDWTSAKLADL